MRATSRYCCSGPVADDGHCDACGKPAASRASGVGSSGEREARMRAALEKVYGGDQSLEAGAVLDHYLDPT